MKMQIICEFAEEEDEEDEGKCGRKSFLAPTDGGVGGGGGGHRDAKFAGFVKSEIRTTRVVR